MTEYKVRLTPYTREVVVEADSENEALEKVKLNPMANRFQQGFSYLKYY